MGKEETENSRRGFFLAWIYGLWGIITGAVAVPAAGYLLFPPHVRKNEEWAEAGDISKVQTGTPVEMVFQRVRTDGWRMISEKTTTFVVKKSDNDIVAFAPGCTHLGCAYHWDEKKSEFLCPCHNSTFGTDGRVLSGPAPRALDRFQTKVENSKLLVGRIVEGNPVGENRS